MSKAKVLEDLIGQLNLFIVPSLVKFDLGSWINDPNKVLHSIESNFSKTESLAVRSSAIDEDGDESAKAGQYESILNVPSTDKTKLISAIDNVCSSYDKNHSNFQNNEIFCQRMVEDVVSSGVIFTHELNKGSPYYVINYDDISGLTDTVTSGGSKTSNKTLWVHRDFTASLKSERFIKLIAAVQELETTLNNQYLDVEFAINSHMENFLLQVRPISTKKTWDLDVLNRINPSLQNIRKTLEPRFSRLDQVYGESSVFGQMPDWNPIEMIGRVPRALALSLYKNLITDGSWAEARKLMGYAIPKTKELLLSLEGQPYIDTRLSFHSFLPADISQDIGEKLVNRWSRTLTSKPELHDKVEFDVAITTYSFDFDEKIDSLVSDTLSEKQKNELKESYFKLTNNLLLNKKKSGINSALHSLEQLKANQESYLKDFETGDLSSIELILSDCRQLGTIPFSILARHGFISKTILLSLQKKGILDSKDIEGLLANVSTVATELIIDTNKLQKKMISEEVFLNRYGHLRPGTYDILSKRYDQMKDLFKTNSNVHSIIENNKREYKLSSKKRKQIDDIFIAHGFKEVDHKIFFEYLSQSIAGREYGKFIFTKSVSTILELIADFGAKINIDRNILSHIQIERLVEIFQNEEKENYREIIINESLLNESKHKVSSAIRLPQILSNFEGIHVVPFQSIQPNFITSLKVIGDSLVVDKSSSNDLDGKIILIEGADPGYDWIFNFNISGLITMYGGANSHMAIRCAEFSIPAAIGCGEDKFNKLKSCSKILLDCSASLIDSIN